MFKLSHINYLLYLCAITLGSCVKSEEASTYETIPITAGDLVFRKGIGVKTQAVLRADSMGIYSHTGIVVMQDSVLKVVHITPGERPQGEQVDRIKIESIADFWRKDRAQHGAVYRLKENRLSKAASEQALRLLKKGVLFDHDYELEDSTKMYCTELVWYAYTQVGEDISFGKRSVLNMPLYGGTYIFPSDIYTNSEFRLIYKF